jgi:acyl carrier protein
MEQTMLAPEEIDARVRRVLGEALGVGKDDINSHTTLQGDLGAESIDFLDIVFRLEGEFRIRIPRGELFPEPSSPDDPIFSRDGLLTAENLSVLRSRMPYVDPEFLEHDPRPRRIADLYTVGLLKSYISWRFGGGRGDGDLRVPAVQAQGIAPR